MSSSNNQSIWRVRGAYFLSVVSITMVLLMLGFIGLLLFNARVLSNEAKKNIGITVFIKNETPAADIQRLKNALNVAPYSTSAHFVSKKEAALFMKDALGNDFTKTLGYNPMLSSIEVYLKPDYVKEDSIKKIEKQLGRFSFIKQVYYQKSLIELVNENVRKMTIVGLILTVFLLMIALSLINNTVRLSVFSKRLLIRSAQLVGANPRFIRRPFTIRNIFSGILSASVASLILTGIVLLLERNLLKVIDIQGLFEIIAFMFLFGILITTISGNFAVNKYLRIKTDDLYFEY